MLGLSASWTGDHIIAHQPLADALDIGAFRRVARDVGLSADPQVGVDDSQRIAAILVKCEPSRDGRIRGEPHTMWNDGDIDAQRHIRAAVGALAAGVFGDTRIFVSGGAEHQGPDGGGLVAVIARVGRGLTTLGVSLSEKPAGKLELVGLLFAAGLGIGLVFPLSKLASMAGISPFAYIGFSALGASLVLVVLARATRAPVRLSPPNLRYAAIAGALTYAIPFGTLTFVVAHLGSGIPAILQSLTPMFTLVLVATLRMERLGLFRVAGLILGLVGVLVIIVSRNRLEIDEASWLWLATAFVTPLALSCGNVYRSYAWPPGEKAVALAVLTFGVAAVLMLAVQGVLLAMAGAPILMPSLSDAVPIIIGQSFASGFGYFFFFRLQQAGGPVYLSQISYVNTTVGVVFAAILFSELIGAMTLLAVLLIFAGIALVNLGKPAAKPDNADAELSD